MDVDRHACTHWHVITSKISLEALSTCVHRRSSAELTDEQCQQLREARPGASAPPNTVSLVVLFE